MRLRIGLLVTCLLIVAGSVYANESLSDPAIQPASQKSELPFDGLPESFQPERSSTEAEQNRRQLTVLLTKARMLDKRGDLPRALKAYQRASRLNPGSESILQNIVRLAFMLKRNEIASRYAVLLAQNKPDMAADALQRLAQYAVENDQVETAISLYERAVTQLESQKAFAQILGIRFRLVKLYQIEEKPAAAAKHAKLLVEMLNDPEQYELKEVVDQFSEEATQATYQELADTLLEAGHTKLAGQAFAKYRESIDPLNAAWFDARIAVAEQQWKQAQSHLQTMLASDKEVGGAESYELLLQIAPHLGDSDSKNPTQRLNDLLAKQPSKVALRQLLVKRFAEEQKWDRVSETAQPLIATGEGQGVYKEAAMAYFQLEQWEPLIALLGATLTPSFTLGLDTKDFESAEAKWKALQEHAKSLVGESPSQRDRIAACHLLAEGNHAELAWKELQPALDKLDKRVASQLLLQFAVSAFANDQEVVAEQALRSGLALRLPKNQASLFQYYLTMVQQLQGNTDDALRTAKRSALLDESSALLRSRIGWVLYNDNQLDKAAEEYRALLTKFDRDYENEQTRDALREARLVLSSIAGQQGRDEMAFEWLEQVLDEFPGDTGASNDLGYLWVDRKTNMGRALDLIELAVAEEPENPAYLDSLGWALFRMGRHQEAASKLKQAVDLMDEPDGVILDHLADAYLANGETEKAKATWKQAIDRLKDEDDQKTLSRVEQKLRQSP